MEENALAQNESSSISATRFVKSYPKGIRQDSSNQNPMISWIGGMQAAALNFQTADEVGQFYLSFFLQ